MKLRVALLARQEIVAAVRWYERQRSALGSEFRAEIERVLRAIEQHPRRFSRVEWTRVPGEVRRARLQRFPYLVIFEVVEDEVQVLACMHTSRRPDYWKRRANRN